MKNKNNVYVEVESKEQAESYRKVLEAIGEPISEYYEPYVEDHNRLIFYESSWMAGYGNEKEKITFGELIDLLQRNPLLISEDGVELFELSPYSCVKNLHGNGWIYCFDEILKPDHFVITDSSICKAFSTKKAALEWIESQKPKAYEVKLLGGKTANVHKDLIRIFDGNNTMNIMPSDLEDLSHSFSLYFGKDSENG